MPWNWDGRGRKSVEHGGSVGTVTETSESKSWPTYDAAYLASRLGGQRAKDAAEMDKYAAAGTMQNEAAQQVYLNKIAEDYKEEADECLKQEFSQWLQGKHDLNDSAAAYQNAPNAAKRRFVFHDQPIRNANGGGVALNGNAPVVGQQMDDWRPTWWGRGSLTHLPGVRDYLRSEAIPANDSELGLNVLAEFGPQNIDQAWMYFKHWVKGRPLSEAACLTKTQHAEDNNFDPSRAYGPSDSFYPRKMPDAREAYKWDETPNWVDSHPDPGRPPRAIPRFCVATEPCDPEDRKKEPSRNSSRKSSQQSSRSGSPPPLIGSSPFNANSARTRTAVDETPSAPSFYPFAQRERAGRTSPVPEEPNFGFGDVQPMTCVQFDQAKAAAAHAYHEKQDDIEERLATLVEIRNSTDDAGGRANVEQRFLETVKESYDLQRAINVTMGNETTTGDVMNDTVDSATYAANVSLMRALSIGNGTGVGVSPQDPINRVLGRGFIEGLRRGTVPDGNQLREAEVDEMITKGGYNFDAMYPLLLATIVTTGVKLTRFDRHVSACMFPPITNREATYRAPTGIDLNALADELNPMRRAAFVPDLDLNTLA